MPAFRFRYTGSFQAPMSLVCVLSCTTPFRLSAMEVDHYTTSSVSSPAENIDEANMNHVIVAPLLFPRSVWKRIALFYIPDGHNDPVKSAKARGVAASVCRELWHLVYDDPSFWSTINLNLNITPERVAFVLDKCGDSELHIRVALIDVRGPSDYTLESEPSVESLIDRMLSAISPTSARWRSFFFYTEHPGAFNKVRDVCFGLSAPILTSISIRYGYMPGYSEFDELDAIYEEPKEAYDWFNRTFSHLDHLELSTVYFPWNTDLFGSLTTLDLSDFDDLRWDFILSLFADASNLLFLRLDTFSGFTVPDGAKLSSNSLLVVDLGFGGHRCLVNLLTALITPNVADLTLRDINDNLPTILQCGVLLGQLVRFAVYGRVTYQSTPVYDRAVLQLFDSMPLLQVLDLHHAYPYLFTSYCVWTSRQLRSPAPSVTGLHSLRALYIARAALPQLLTFLVSHGIDDGSSGNHMNLRTIRALPSLPSDNPELWLWFKDHVTDFGCIQFVDRTLSVICGPSYHSLYCFLP
ncbi:hypothetical protein B0H17DRAFT_1150494 [Mycena rosella]|uniref:Uncharacterized protein n=1 Tax=Mycena rosella TaxID=1033263 RepID=A0AAD7FNU7_MYCRO|nr:hypothetical protein B0H17DRAFT_1150494 [Mycena rosella]